VIGQVIGNYRIESVLGKGGMGMVYRAEHTQLGRPAALKMLLPQYSSDPAIVQRFFNEARAASAIDHPGIVEIYDFGTHTDGAAYIVMALLKGESLEARLRRGPLPPLEGASIVAQVLGALAAAHAAGIVHRDLKPDNIFLVPNELMPNGVQIKLLDFGIAKLGDDHGSAGMRTQTGVMMGTPAYMSPEQCMGKSDLDHRTDLYAIGCILYHVLTGRPPFVSDQGTGMMIAMHIRDAAPHPRALDPRSPDSLAAIVMRLLEKEPAARYQTALEVRDALAAIGASAQSRPPVAVDQFGATMAPNTVRREALLAAVAQQGAGQTTAAGSAAQVMPSPTVPARSGGRAGVILGVGALLAALGGVGVWAAMRGGSTSTPAAGTTPAGSATVSATPPPATSGSAVAPAATPPASPTAPELTNASAAAEPCPLGQVRGLDTREHCCWPDQAWSSAKNRCIGAPRCPPAHKATGDDCVAVVAEAAKPPVPARPEKPPPHGGGEHGTGAIGVPDDPSVTPTRPVPPPPPTGPVPTFKLPGKELAAGAKFQITFAGPVPSPANSRSWITIVEANKPGSQYGDWTYIDDGAKTASLTAPTAPGAYEVRLHTDYPRLSTNVRHRVPVTIKDSSKPQGSARNDWRFMLAAKTARVGEEIEVTFPVALKAPVGEKFWITVVPKGAADSSYATWSYVPDAARMMPFKMPTQAGDYEIRLHANYPRLSTNVVHRAAIRVED
jgi:serine/threonine-protein kinase